MLMAGREAIGALLFEAFDAGGLATKARVSRYDDRCPKRGAIKGMATIFSGSGTHGMEDMPGILRASLQRRAVAAAVLTGLLDQPQDLGRLIKSSGAAAQQRNAARISSMVSCGAWRWA